ncbi:hypothetical protein PR202_ga27106 [Eleusine coracana subsp. coracana]|uniref:Uncharacterized protein n=1 Tax=Eleusine coracana subsp. coracana TaxID=191504 RepID=A0AAV5DFU4_ELECO|nr:hypothetical protein PR202_ga27106 [Eleusine coracana subsp. coracana]
MSFQLTLGTLDHRLTKGRRIGADKSGVQVIVRDEHGVENFGIDRLVLQINHVHLLADALQCRLCAKRGKVGSNVAVRVLGHNLQVDILCKLHVLGVDAQYFKSPYLIRHANVDFTVEPSQSWVDAVGAVMTMT